MKIKSLYEPNEEITIDSYLQKCGVEDVENYTKALTVEPIDHYMNTYKWCRILKIALETNSKIYLLEDSDCDGLFSTATQYMYCKMIEPNCDIEIIVHSQENPKAHGLDDKEVMEYLLSQAPSYLFINDAGTNDVEKMRQLSERGWIIACSDHHQMSDKINSNPYCVLVNNQLSPNVINKGLSGCGTTWKCCKHYDELYGYKYAPTLISYVAMSIISDSMDLTYDENYTFVKWGRERLHKNLIPFVQQLNKDGDCSNNKAFSFGMITNFNSLIRLGTSQDKLDLTYAICGEYDNEQIDGIIKKCKTYHNKQQTETKRIMENSIEDIYNGKIYLGRVLEKTPLTGLVANKLLSEYNKPIILVHERDNGECAGSCRSNIDLKDELNNSGLFEYAEGHKQSFGLCYLKSNEQDVVNYLYTSVEVCEPYISVLSDLTITSIPNYLYSFKDSYKCYFGTNIPIPKFYIEPFTIDSNNISIIGKNNNVFKFSKNGIEFIKFFCGQKDKDNLFLEDIKNHKLTIDIVGELSYNVFRDKVNKQCIIDKYEVEEKKELTINDIF